ncbi:MAG TPA: hypothetical protein VF112_07855 [Candidatus Dormibacteraeota bacterium]
MALVIAVLAVAAVSAAVRPAAGPAVADRPCTAAEGGGVLDCSDVDNDSLNGISIHILGH